MGYDMVMYECNIRSSTLFFVCSSFLYCIVVVLVVISINIINAIVMKYLKFFKYCILFVKDSVHLFLISVDMTKPFIS